MCFLYYSIQLDKGESMEALRYTTETDIYMKTL